MFLKPHKFSSYLISTAIALGLAACADLDKNESDTYSQLETGSEYLFTFDEKEPSYMLTGDNADFTIFENRGEKQLSINFDDDEKFSRVMIKPNTSFDWSAEDNFQIAIDVENKSDQSVYFYLGLHDSDNQFQNKGLIAPANSKGTYYAVVKGPFLEIDSGLRENPSPWFETEEMMIRRWTSGNPMNFSEISGISFFTRGIIADKSVSIDNIRLRQNPTIPTDYMKDIVDEFGQAKREDYPIKVSSAEELKRIADAELSELESAKSFADRSKFGGWKDGPKLEATGYFRVEKVDGQWWFVDPEGYLFFSHGVANVRIANLTTLTGIDFRDESIRYVDESEVTPEDSIGFVDVSDEARETRYVSSELRHGMFDWLPDYDDPLADHYSFRRSALMGPIDGGETFSFYTANLERRYGEDAPQSYMDKWVDVTLKRMKSWGFTSFGNWVDPAFYPNEHVPYFANGWIIGDYQTLEPDVDIWGPMPDFYDPKFRERAEATISVIAQEIKGSPWCVGIFIDNEKSWGDPSAPDEKRYAVIMDAFSKPASESFAKAEFVKQLKDKYSDIALVNQAWNTDFKNWSEFEAGFTPTEFPKALIADMSELYEAFSEEYFKIVDETLNAYLPNHLYMGARMASWGMPAETVKAATKYSDVMSFNIYEEGLRKGGWDFFEDINKPVVIGEFHIGAMFDTGLYHPGLTFAADQADRARLYKAYMETVISNPYLVGAHWFQYVDSPITGRAFDGENYNVGFVSGTDIPYPEMVEAAREVMTNIYPKKFSNTEAK